MNSINTLKRYLILFILISYCLVEAYDMDDYHFLCFHGSRLLSGFVLSMLTC